MSSVKGSMSHINILWTQIWSPTTYKNPGLYVLSYMGGGGGFFCLLACLSERFVMYKDTPSLIVEEKSARHHGLHAILKQPC